MRKKLLQEAEKYAKQNHRRRVWRKFVQVMACVVVFCTTYALILPAITMEKTWICGMEEHVHTDACYKKIDTLQSRKLICTYASAGGHVHTEACEDDSNTFICGNADFFVHSHDADCRNENGELVCQLPEIEEHTHTQDCYREVEAASHTHEDACYETSLGDLVCGIEASQGHAHGENCYQQGDLICQKLEQEAHTHGEACSERVLVCEVTMEPHIHGPSCYEEKTCELTEDSGHVHDETCTGTVLVCDLTEQPHAHTDGCYQTNITCDLPETEGHAHTAECYEWDLTCELPETEGHAHTDSCREQIKTLICPIEPEIEVRLELDCEKEEIEVHSHEDGCYETELDAEGNEQKRLVCEKIVVLEHVHGENCFVTEEVPAADVDTLTCTLTEGHVHGEGCYDESGKLICPEEENHVHGDICYGTWEMICGKEEHTHTEACRPQTYHCGNEAHSHEENCYDAEGNLICELAEHIHSEACLAEPVYYCGLEPHGHDEDCRDAEGNLICQLPEHAHSETCLTHSLTEEEWTQVQQVIALIDTMPSADEIDAKLMEYEEAGDLAGQDTYFEEVWTQVCDVYTQYSLLSDKQKICVTNADKLMALEYMWGEMEEASTYAAEITGYNMDANNIIPIDGYLGWQAAYFNGTLQPHSGEGDYHGLTKEMLGANGCNVIYIDLPVVNGTNWHNLSSYFLNGENVNGTKQGVFNVDLYNDWCAVSVETCAEYPFFYVRQLVNHDTSDKARIGRMSTTTTNGFLLLIRRSYIEENNLYIPTGNVNNFAYVHLNKEDLYEQTGRVNFEEKSNWLPSSLDARSTYGYVTFSPMDTVPDAGARSDDMKVVDNINFKLFDYSNYINKTTVTEDDSSYRALASYFYFRGGFVDEGRDYGLDVARYTPNVNPEVPQDGKGHELYDQDGYTVNHARVEPNLWNGYPILDFTKNAKGEAITTPSSWGTGQLQHPRSLKFLFNQYYADNQTWGNDRHKIAPGAVTEYSPTNTILQFNEDTHTYWYDSAKHAVDYDIDAQEFRVRKYTERTSITADWPFDDSAGSGDFLPFNYSNGIVNATYHSGSQPGVKSVADSSFRMNDVNYWFGMSMEFSFIQGKDGKVTYTNASGERKADPMVFKFSGDDDVWVFIDGVRILDLGGTHGSVTGIIDFTTGNVTQKLTWGEDPNKSYPTTLKKCFDLAGKSPKGGWDDTGERFADYSVHTLKFYYLERGTAVANCAMEFNLPNFDTPLAVGKTLSAKDENVDSDVLGYLQDTQEYSYRVLVADENGNVLKDANGNPILFMREGREYTLLDHEDPQRIGTKRTVGENGIFKLKHGQQAVFEDILTIAKTIAAADGKSEEDYKYFVIEEILPNNQTGHYNKVQYTLDTTVGTMMGEADDTLQDFMGYYTPSISIGEPQHVQYNNTVDTETLSKLRITKAVTEDSGFDAEQEFTVNVKLDGEYLAAGTKYSIDDTEYEIGTNGSIVLKTGQTAEVLVPVLAGTTFEVEEVAETGWVVTYKNVTTDADGNETTASGNSGSFPMDGIVHVTVTNSTYRYRLPLTFTKKAMYSKDKEYDFSFSITQSDENGNAVDATPGIGLPSAEDLTIKAICQSVVSKEVFFTFDSTVPTGTYYFKLVEEDKASWIDDPSVYIIGITITDTGASITSITKDGVDYGATNSPAFVNYMERNVLVYKTVTGNFTQDELTKPFTFTAIITLDGNKVTPKTIIRYTKSGDTETSEQLTDAVGDDGTITFTLTHNQYVKLTGVPYSAKITVTETKADGYIVTHSIVRNDATYKKDVGSNTVSDFSVTYSNNHIYFTNKGGYELPHTGGAGTTTYTMAGLVLMLFSMAYLMYRPKARRREEF